MILTALASNEKEVLVLVDINKCVCRSHKVQAGDEVHVELFLPEPIEMWCKVQNTCYFESDDKHWPTLGTLRVANMQFTYRAQGPYRNSAKWTGQVDTARDFVFLSIPERLKLVEFTPPSTLTLISATDMPCCSTSQCTANHKPSPVNQEKTKDYGMKPHAFLHSCFTVVSTWPFASQWTGSHCCGLRSTQGLQSDQPPSALLDMRYKSQVTHCWTTARHSWSLCGSWLNNFWQSPQTMPTDLPKGAHCAGCRRRVSSTTDNTMCYSCARYLHKACAEQHQDSDFCGSCANRLACGVCLKLAPVCCITRACLTPS